MVWFQNGSQGKERKRDNFLGRETDMEESKKGNLIKISTVRDDE